MSYKFSRGAQVIGDLKAQDDTQRDTLIDFGEDQIEFQTSGSVRLQISNDHLSSSLPVTASSFAFADSIKIAGAPPGQDTVIDNQGNFYGDTIDVGTVSASAVVITDSGSPVYQLPVTDGNADEVMATDGAGSVSYRPVDELGAASFLHYGYNPVFSGTGPIETTTVNGSTNDYGYRMPLSGTITHMTNQFQFSITTSGSYDFLGKVFLNGVQVASGSNTIAGNAGFAGSRGFVTTFSPPISFDPDDTITIKVNFDAAGISADDLASLLRVITTIA
jgi:hypothetical protein